MDLRALFMGVAFAAMWSSAFATARIIVAGAPPLHALALRFKDTYGIRQVLPIQDMHGVYSFYFEDLDHNWWEIQYYENGFVHDDYFDFGDRFDMTPSEETRA